MDLSRSPLPTKAAGSLSQRREIMKKHNKTLICAFAAAVTILAAAPAAAHAAEGDPISTAPATTAAASASTTTAAASTTTTAQASTTTAQATTTTAAASTTAAPATSTAPATTSAVTPSIEGWHIDTTGRITYYKADGSFLTGTQEIDGEKYIFSKNGVLKTGWRTVGGKRLYYAPDTGKPVYGWLEYCGRKYYITKEDGKVTGLFTDKDGKQYRFSDMGVLIAEKGFFKVYSDVKE